MRTLILILFLGYSFSLYSQEEPRIQSIKNQLELLSVDNAGLTETLKLEINVSNVSLSNFLIGISKVHHINMNVDPALSDIAIVNNFSSVTIADLLVFLAKKYQLHIDFTGNILSVSKY
ncbi:MAG: general secretion pathway protein GspD, partial [Sinomicrobium sp.]|nr:general secretion pathway protein GspD [Sinomicrobium sp.]